MLAFASMTLRREMRGSSPRMTQSLKKVVMPAQAGIPFLKIPFL